MKPAGIGNIFNMTCKDAIKLVENIDKIVDRYKLKSHNRFGLPKI